MNLVLGIFSVIITFSLVVLIEKIFKKEGLFVWISIATIIANILVCKSINILGIATCLGNVMFASSFLATDIMSEKYGAKYSQKAILLGVCSQIIFIIITQLALLYTPNEIDQVNDSMKNLFAVNIRVSIASVTTYCISNLFDIYVFEVIKKKIPNMLWIRNNVSTIICNCLENYIFTFLAFTGMYDLKTMLTIATFSSLIEMIIAIADTPFLYISFIKENKSKGNDVVSA